MPYDGQSHFDTFRPLFEVMGQRGHNVTIISCSRTPFVSQNIQSIWLECEEKIHIKSLLEGGALLGFYSTPNRLSRQTERQCEYGLQIEAFRSFLHEMRNTTFDIILLELFVTDCFLGVANIFQAPMIGKFKSNIK